MVDVEKEAKGTAIGIVMVFAIIYGCLTMTGCTVSASVDWHGRTDVNRQIHNGSDWAKQYGH